MNISSTVLTASILSFVSTLLITQVIGRFIDHNYDKVFKELDKNLKIQNALPDDMQSDTLDQLIRQQFNAYLLSRSRAGLGKQVFNRIWLGLYAGMSALCVALTIWSAMEGRVWWASVSFFGVLSFGAYYFDRRRAWTRKGMVQNTKYRAIFKNGVYSNGSVLIDILQDGDSNVAIDYPRVVITDNEANKIHIYNRIKSEGTLSVNSGDDTDLKTTYEYSGSVPLTNESVAHSKKQAVIRSNEVRTHGVLYPRTEEIPLLSIPIHEVVTTGKKLGRFIARVNRTNNPNDN